MEKMIYEDMDPRIFSEFERNLPDHHMIFVEGGSFEMGDHEIGEIKTTAVESFFLAEVPVTFPLYSRFDEYNEIDSSVLSNLKCRVYLFLCGYAKETPS